MSLQSWIDKVNDAGFPRVSGDEPRERGLLWYDSMFSPRERG